MVKALKLMDLPENERPQERLLRYGAEALSNSELLAVILRTGTREKNILNLCSSLLKETGGLNGLVSFGADDLRKIHGIGEVKTAQLIAILELSKRFRSYKSGIELRISKPEDVASFVMEEMRSFQQEYLRVLMLNTKNVVVFVKDVSMGSLNSSIVHPREVFCEAIKRSSASIIICHNHPSGDPTPSSEDISITKRLRECGKMIGIELLDHIIIGNGIYVSLKDKGLL